MLRHVGVFGTDVSMERAASIFRVERISVSKLIVTANVVRSSLVLPNLKMEATFPF
jgi:hypothetical protein